MRQFDKSLLLSTFDKVLERQSRSEARQRVTFVRVEKPKRSVFPILYLPVEVKARELAAKGVIARQALGAGFNVVIGSAWPLMGWYKSLAPGIILFKTMNAMDAHNMALWAQHGHFIAALDDEAFGIRATPDYLAATIHPHASAVADVVCAQGPAYARAFPFPVSLHVTGNPRALTYSASRGNDILVCLQSGNINNYGRSFEEMVSKTLGLGQSLQSAEGLAWARILRESIAHECDVLPLVSATIAALAEAFPDRKVVVRPHPVEDPSIWSFPYSNVIMDKSESVADSLGRAGNVVFVSGCTTGLDAYLAGVPAVRLGSGGHGISSEMHISASTPGDAVEAVRRGERWTGTITDHLADLDIINPLMEIHRTNAAVGAAQIAIPTGFEPTEFRKQKFSDTGNEEIEQLVGRPCQRIAWNTFFATPGS
ncbi:MAG: hypothetical protein EPO08_00635 [Rhodospirillaceae bacterium]|nr:MAG: hypothetical protein EPO08_00635 [Rhodospirillaceae bacterium]